MCLPESPASEAEAPKRLVSSTSTSILTLAGFPTQPCGHTCKYGTPIELTLELPSSHVAVTSSHHLYGSRDRLASTGNLKFG